MSTAASFIQRSHSGTTAASDFAVGMCPISATDPETVSCAVQSESCSPECKERNQTELAERVFLTVFSSLHLTENSRQSKVEGEISKSKWKEILIFSAAYYSFEEDPSLSRLPCSFSPPLFSLFSTLPTRSTLHSAAPPPQCWQRRRSSAGSFIRERARWARARALDVSCASQRMRRRKRGDTRDGGTLLFICDRF